MGRIKDRNATDLKRSRRYQEEVARIHRNYTKNYLYGPDNHDGVITNLEPDIQAGFRKGRGTRDHIASSS